MSYVIHCSKKLFNRIKPSVNVPDDASDTLLGNWYSTALIWKPLVAQLVNEKTKQ